MRTATWMPSRRGGFAATVAWYENQADGSTWVTHLIAALQAPSVFGADIDGDGDGDVLFIDAAATVLVWYENSAGDGSSWTRHLIASPFNPKVLIAADLDAVSGTTVEVAWYENTDGAGTFGPKRNVSLPLEQVRGRSGPPVGRGDAPRAGRVLDEPERHDSDVGARTR